MKIKKTSLISYLLIISLLLTSVLPAFAQENADVAADGTVPQNMVAAENASGDEGISGEFDPSDPDSILYGSDIDETYDEQAEKIDENIQQLHTDEAELSEESQPAEDGGELPEGEESENEEASEYEDVSHMSDEEFFGEWDYETETWKTVGKLNYDYSPDLSEVERLVKLNSYSMAKDALLEYYRNRTSVPRASYSGNIDWGRNFMNMRDAYTFTEPYITYTNVTNTDEYKEYKVDLMGYSTTSVFVLSSLEKTQDMVSVASRESGLSPTLEIVTEDGQTVTLYPEKDTYIRGLDESEDYSGRIYGASKELLIKDSYYQHSNGTYKPYSSKSRRAYIAFDIDKFPGDISQIYLKFYAKIVPEEGVEAATETNHEIVIFNAYNKSWEEVEAEGNKFKPMTWKDYKIGHYSWNGIPGGFDWKRPDNVASEWFTENTRFYANVSMAKSSIMLDNTDYMKKSIEVTLDFIKDTNGMIQVGNVPANRDIESANRMCEMPGLFAGYLDSDLFNAEAMTAILKWTWEEMTYLYNGAGILYEGATDKPTANNYAETNRGLWHVKGTEGVCTYFPEFADRDMWKELADKRLVTVAMVLVNDDGCYQEATFSYAVSMLNMFISIYQYLQDSGDEVPEWYMERIGNFARYIMYVSNPQHVPPRYGEGAAGSTVSALKNYLTLAEDEELEYVVTDGADGVKPEILSEYFQQLKLASCRTGWATDDSMLYMIAKNGGNHNHKDSLHMMFFAGDRYLLDDTGMTSYDSGHPHFQWQRHATRSHNTIEINGIPQRGSDFLYNYSSDPSKWNGDSSLELYTSEPVDRIVAWTDANVGFRHYRNVSYVKNQNFLIVSDMVSPEDATVENSYTQNWHTDANDASNPAIDNVTKIGRTNYHGGSNLIIAQANTDGIDLTLETGYSAKSSNPTEYFCYTKKAAGDVMFNTVLYPTRTGTSSDISVENIDTGVDPAVASAMDINLFKDNNDVLNVFYYNSFEEVPSERSFNGYTTDSANVTIEQDVDGIPQFLSMYNGSKVLRGDSEIIVSDTVLSDIEIQFDGTEARITGKDENMLSAKLTFLAPYKITKVTINGEEVDFVCSNNKVYVNNHEVVDFGTDSGYLIRQTAENSKGDRFGVVFDIPKDSVTNGSLSYPSVTYSNNVFNVSFGSGVLSSSAKITFAGHTGKNVVATIDGVKENITNKIKVGSTREEADSQVVPGAPLLERAREDLVIWTKDITDFKIGAAAVSEGSGGGGNAGSPGVKPLPPAGSDTDDGDKESDSSSSDNTGSSGGRGSSSHGGTAFVPVDTNIGFEDCKNHWAKDDIAYMYAKGFVNGISETAFAPDRNVTRAEFAAMAVRVLGIEAAGFSGAFADVSEGDWYAGSVEAAYSAGLIQGSEGLFRPDDGITREEMAVILMRAYRLGREFIAKGGLSFADSGDISAWAIDSVIACSELGMINGMTDGRFAPADNTTRAQAVAVFKRLLDMK